VVKKETNDKPFVLKTQKMKGCSHLYIFPFSLSPKILLVGVNLSINQSISFMFIHIPRKEKREIYAVVAVVAINKILSIVLAKVKI